MKINYEQPSYGFKGGSSFIVPAIESISKLLKK
jgi:hypothetical protein